MISDSLRPAPLPKGRLTPLQIGLILLGCALLGGLFYAVDVPAATVLVLGLGVGVLCVKRFDTAFYLQLGIGMSVSMNFLLGLRSNTGGMLDQLNLLDFAAGLVILAMLVNLLGRPDDLRLPRHIRSSYTAFALVTVFGFIYGILSNSGSLPTYLRDLRLFTYMHLGLLGVAWFIRTPKQVRQLATLIILAGVICSLQQIGRFVLYGSVGMNLIRDVSLPFASMHFAVITLIIYRYHRIKVLPRNTYPFVLTLLLVASLVSFTRSLWLWLILSYPLALLYMGGKQRARSILVTLGIVATLVFVVPFAVDLNAHDLNLQDMIQSRVQQVAGKNDDLATQARLVTYYDAWNSYLQSPVWGLGAGFPVFVYNMDKRQTEEVDLHNSLLFYAIKVGAIGLFVMIWLFVAAIRKAARMASPRVPAHSPEQWEVKALAQSLVAAFIPFSLIGIWSANLNYVAYMPFLGMIVGLNWDKLYDRARDHASSPSAAPDLVVNDGKQGEPVGVP